MPRRRDQYPLVILTGLPWWVGLAFAVVVYAGVRWLLPSLWANNQALRPLAAALSNIAWLIALPFVVVAGLSALGSSYRRHLLDAQRDLDTLKALSWQDFERLVGEAYRRQGYAVEEVGGSAPDGGIDLLLRRQRQKVIVQCKRWKSAQVGVSLIREFYGATVAERATRGIFVTTGTYTPDAIEFARDKPLELVDGAALAALVEGVQTDKPPATAAPATPLCPKCGGEMVKRVAKRGGNAGGEFWGCRRYPACKGVRNAA
jgi:restriction system protein